GHRFSLLTPRSCETPLANAVPTELRGVRPGRCSRRARSRTNCARNSRAFSRRYEIHKWHRVTPAGVDRTCRTSRAAAPARPLPSSSQPGAITRGSGRPPTFSSGKYTRWVLGSTATLCAFGARKPRPRLAHGAIGGHRARELLDEPRVRGHICHFSSRNHAQAL